MSVLTGINAAVNGISTVNSFTIDRTSTPGSTIASNTGNAPLKTKGILAWSGTITAKGSAPSVSNMPGLFFVFTGYVGPDTDVVPVGAIGTTYTGTAIVDSIAITFDHNTNEANGYVISFSGHLALTFADGQAEILDATTPDIENPCGFDISWSPQFNTTTPVINILTAWTTATLTITAENVSYSDSSTHVVDECWMGMKRGNIGFTLDISQNESEVALATTMVIGTNIGVRIAVNGTDNWELQYCHVENISDVNCDRTTGDIISITTNLSMSSHDDAGVLGYIALPGEDPAVQGEPFWPFT